MMKRLVVLLSIAGMLVFGLAILAVSGDLPPTDAGKLWTHITKTDPYQKGGFEPIINKSSWLLFAKGEIRYYYYR